MMPGANVSAVARSHGLKPQQLFGWRRRALAEAREANPEADVMGSDKIVSSDGRGTGFVEVSVLDGRGTGTVDVIVGGDVTIRVGPGVSMARLQMVLRAVRAA
jgi:transposase